MATKHNQFHCVKLTSLSSLSMPVLPPGEKPHFIPSRGHKSLPFPCQVWDWILHSNLQANKRACCGWNKRQYYLTIRDTGIWAGTKNFQSQQSCQREHSVSSLNTDSLLVDLGQLSDAHHPDKYMPSTRWFSWQLKTNEHRESNLHSEQ